MIDLAPLFVGSLRPSDFSELGLSSRQLHVWTNLTGFQPAERDDGKWRQFSPADVFRLFVLRDLKTATGLAISDHPELVRTIRTDAFFTEALMAWAKGDLPCLVTDLGQHHGLALARELKASDLMQTGRLHCLLPLSPSFEHMAAAIARNGTQEHRMLIHALVIAKPKQAALEAPPVSNQSSAPRPARRGRVLEV